MRFKKIEATNFLSFKSLNFKLPSAGLYFVGGEIEGKTFSNSNGAGKSALFEALCFGLYGKTIRKLSIDDVINRSVKKNCSVDINFEIDDDDYHVTRFRNDSEFGDALVLLKNNKVDLTEGKKKDTQSLIDYLLGMSWAVFSTAVIFGEKARRFSEATGAEKNEVLNDILLLYPFDEAQKKVKDDLKKIKSDFDLNNIAIKSLNDVIEVIRSGIKEEKENLNEAKEKQKSAKSKINELNSKINEIDKEVTKIENEIENVLSSVTKVNAEHAELGKEFESIKQKSNDEIEPLINDLRQVEANKNLLVSMREDTIAKLSNQGKFKIGERCPTCQSVITEDNMEEVRKHFEKDKKELDVQIKNHQEIIVKAKPDIDAVKKKWDKKSNEVHQLQLEIEETMKDFSDEKAELTIKKNGLRTKKQSIFDEISLIKDYSEKAVEDAKRRISVKDKQLTEKESELLKLEDVEKTIKEDLKYYDFWIVGFSNTGIKSFLLDEVVPELNTRIGYYSSALMDDMVKIQFDTESKLKSGEVRNKFNIKIVINDEDIEYESFSQGERARIDVAVLLALQSLIFHRNAKNSNIVIFDEVFENLDVVGIERAVNLLRDEAKEKAIFVISHQNELKDYFDNQILVKKNIKEESYLEL